MTDTYNLTHRTGGIMEAQTEWLEDHPWLKDTDDSGVDEDIRFSLDELRLA